MKETIAAILGNINRLAELTPIISSASICSVTRMVPISEAMFDPTLPAKIRHNMEEENSNKMTSRVANPTAYAGIMGDTTFFCICMAITAPMKTEIVMTMGIESIPNLYISEIYLLKNSLHRSGIVNTRLINKT